MIFACFKKAVSQAALFCYGMSHRVGKKVLFSMVEKQDYDFVVFYQDDDVQRFVPVQLKELVPPETVPHQCSAAAACRSWAVDKGSAPRLIISSIAARPSRGCKSTARIASTNSTTRKPSAKPSWTVFNTQ